MVLRSTDACSLLTILHHPFTLDVSNAMYLQIMKVGPLAGVTSTRWTISSASRQRLNGSGMVRMSELQRLT
jgi:hypothetical protein